MKDLKIHDTLLGCFSAAPSFIVLDLGLKMLDCRLQPRHATLGRTPERYAGADSPFVGLGVSLECFWVIWILVVACRFFFGRQGAFLDLELGDFGPLIMCNTRLCIYWN